jgi:hypothetical protein
MNHIEKELNKLKNYLSSNNESKISLESIEEQLNLFMNGVKIPRLIKPCTIDDGILKISEKEFDELINEHNSASSKRRLLKFVPASGAASRMFHKLQSVLNRFDNFSLNYLKNKSEQDSECKSVYNFLTNLKKFAFYNELKSILKLNDDEIEEFAKENPKEIIKKVLFQDGLNYSSSPKGAIKFHKYEKDYRTAFAEQVYEALYYIIDGGKIGKIHFTISEEHSELFINIIEHLKSKLSEEGFRIMVSYSYQKKSTDTIAVDRLNNILFDKSGSPIHRPGGHGALIENLNDLNADIVIIKNIDNLSMENLAEDTILYKKLLIGLLVKIQNQVFSLIKDLQSKKLTKTEFKNALNIAENNLFIKRPFDFDNWNERKQYNFLFNKLNRPIRICGMVKNEGEPGGGPFWVKSDDGILSLQIVEQAQINMNDVDQKRIFLQSTHFNPVDLVCAVKDYKGNNFDLHKFVDHKSGIITIKSKDGIELKALELPGLWNGGMADWITIFVEVPITTFNPVKEVNDLLKKAHQS